MPLAQAIAAHRPWLRLRGLQAYHGARAAPARRRSERAGAIEAAAARAALFRSALERAGHACAEVTGGGNRHLSAGAGQRGLDRGPARLLRADGRRLRGERSAARRRRRSRQALEVLCTVITARDTHAVLDAGLKAFAVDSGLPLLAEPGWRVRGLSDEHAVLVPDAGARPLRVGEKLRAVPGHCDPTVNLHDWIVAHRGGRVEQLWPIEARGAVF